MNEKILVTISREFGSGGHSVGEKLAEKLGVSFYDNELIRIAAEKMGFNEDFVKENEERIPDYSVSSMFSGLGSFTSNPSDRIQEHEFDIIRDIASRESCVIVGRAADYILHSQPHVSIFIFAPIEARINRLKNDHVHYKAYLPNEKYSEADLAKAVRAIDKQRRRYYEFYTENSWGDRDVYDLLINTDRAGIDGAVDIIETYIRAGRGKDILSDL